MALSVPPHLRARTGGDLGEESAGGTVNITLNDRPAELPQGATVSSLLDSLGLVERRVAVERNGEIVPRAQYAQIPLSEGDRIEVVQFVGGG